MKRINMLAGLILCLALAGGVSPAYSQRVIKIKLGTVAPKGTLWHQVLQRMSQDWEKVSDGRVTIKIYPNGSQGDEVEMLRKVRRGLFQAVALSGAGLAHAERGVSSLQIPMMISSYEELDYVRDRLAPKLEKMLADKDLIVLNWSDVGWVHFFSKKPARTLDDIRKMKLFTSAGDPETESLYREFGFNPIPMPVTDMVPNLTTGLIDAFDVPPLFALSDQSFALAKNMIDVKWAALIGATVISKETWERIPADMRPKLLEAARNAAELFRDNIRKMGEEAITVMKRHGLKVTRMDEELQRDWQDEADAAYPKIRDALVPADLFDEVLDIRNEYRKKQQDKAADTDGSLKAGKAGAAARQGGRRF